MNWTIVCTGLAALAVSGCIAAQDDRSTYYWSNGERVSVVVAPSSVAVRFSVDPDPVLIAQVARDNGLLPDPDAAYAPLRGNGIVVYSVPGAAPITNRSIVELQDRLRRSNAAVADVARVLTTATGAAALTQQLSVGFVDGVSGLGDLRGLDVERFVSVVGTMNERPLVVAYSVNVDSDRTALEIANAIFEYRDDAGRRLVTYASPALKFATELRAIPNQPRHPNDPKYKYQWHLDAAPGDVDAPEAWDYTRGSTSQPNPPSGCKAEGRIRVAVLDNGVETTHLDLKDNVSPDGKDYSQLPPGDDPTPNPTATNRRHGTQAAGVIAACGNNGEGVSGVCPLCEILPIKINPADMSQPLAPVFALYAAAGTLEADVISNSWGTVLTDDYRIALDTITGALTGAAGIPVFFAMPNEPSIDLCATDTSGAASVIAVGGSSQANVAGDVASSGACIDLVAPTVHYLAPSGMVVTTDLTSLPGTTYTTALNGFGGASSATALAAGIAGLVLSLNPELTQRDVRNILQHTAVKLPVVPATDVYVDGFSPRAGFGRVNAHRAVVPVVKIEASKQVVQVGEPFDITVSASAPHLVAEIGWSRGVATCPPGVEEWRIVDGKAFHEETWAGVTLPDPGVYRFYPNARDSLWGTSDGYPHMASQAFPKLDEVVIEVQGLGTRASSGCTTPNPPTNLRSDP